MIAAVLEGLSEAYQDEYGEYDESYSILLQCARRAVDSRDSSSELEEAWMHMAFTTTAIQKRMGLNSAPVYWFDILSTVLLNVAGKHDIPSDITTISVPEFLTWMKMVLLDIANDIFDETREKLAPLLRGMVANITEEHYGRSSRSLTDYMANVRLIEEMAQRFCDDEVAILETIRMLRTMGEALSLRREIPILPVEDYL
ncbi:hypothetical protein HDU85_001977 [Gaertneriomyces sp. JEL0708]|nr:hypothetical protein HDU85_001977 [Gaertneriomyces sp. JEL0708]